MRTGVADVRRAARTLRRSPGFVVAAVLSLSLAIALNTTVYSLLDALIDPQLDIRAPEQLYRLRYFGDVHHRLPRNAIEDALQSGLHGYEGVTGSRPYAVGRSSLVEHGARFHDATPLVVRPNFFALLGTHASAGRVFSAGDVDEDARLAVISDRLAVQLFTEDESPVGARIDVNGDPYTVVGIVTRYAAFPGLDSDLWLLPQAGIANAVPISLVRLRHGVTPKSASAELSVLAARLAAAAGEGIRETRFYLSDRAVRQFHAGNFHYALVAAVVAILLVACGNLATLQLARGMTRGPELALRAAVGATRSHIVAMLMLESAILAAAGLLVGLLLTFWGMHLIRVTIPSDVADLLVRPHVSWRLVCAAIVVTTLSLLLAGLVPAISLARVDPNTLLKRGAGTGEHRRHRRRYGLMVVVQIGLALPLLVGSVFVGHAAWQLGQRDFLVGRWFAFDPARIVAVTVPLASPVGSGTTLAATASDVVGRLRAIAGVEDAAAYVSGSPANSGVTIEDADGLTHEVPAPGWRYVRVSPSYFRTIGRQMSQGTDFVEGAYGAGAVVVDEPTAKFLWANADPIGRLIKLGDSRSTEPWARVIGVVHDPRDSEIVQQSYLMSGHRLGDVYRVFTTADSVIGRGTPEMGLYVRSREDVHRAAVDVRHALGGDPGSATLTVGTVEDRSGIVQRRTRAQFVTTIFSLFALVAVGLVVLGIYGIVSHSVNDRRREFGVRISLGATSRDILRTVLGEGTVLSLSGVAIGLYFAFRTVGWLGLFLNTEDDYHNPLIFIAMAAILVGTVALAALGPALRATRVDPVESLRNE